MGLAHRTSGFHHVYRGLAAAAVALLLAVGCAQGGPPKATPLAGEAGRPATVPFQIGVSDTLSVRVLPDPPIERVARVRPDGRFSMDLIGDVEAAGRSTDEVAREIEERIAEYRVSPKVTVSVEQIQSTAVSVTGEVNGPSSFPLERETRLSEAVAQAGGATTFAATSRVRVIRRDGDKTLRYLVNLDRIQGGDASTDLVLEKGDLVYVPAATPVVIGYNVRRVLYPFEVLLQTIAGPLLGFAIGR
jgi:polysaccharide export outer membrane protein